MPDLMDDKQAVEEVCRIGQKIESDADRAEVEAYFRSWVVDDNAHDPEAMRLLR